MSVSADKQSALALILQQTLDRLRLVNSLLQLSSASGMSGRGRDRPAELKPHPDSGLRKLLAEHDLNRDRGSGGQKSTNTFRFLSSGGAASSKDNFKFSCRDLVHFVLFGTGAPVHISVPGKQGSQSNHHKVLNGPNTSGNPDVAALQERITAEQIQELHRLLRHACEHPEQYRSSGSTSRRRSGSGSSDSEGGDSDSSSESGSSDGESDADSSDDLQSSEEGGEDVRVGEKDGSINESNVGLVENSSSNDTPDLDKTTNAGCANEADEFQLGENEDEESSLSSDSDGGNHESHDDSTVTPPKSNGKSLNQNGTNGPPSWAAFAKQGANLIAKEKSRESNVNEELQEGSVNDDDMANETSNDSGAAANEVSTIAELASGGNANWLSQIADQNFSQRGEAYIETESEPLGPGSRLNSPQPGLLLTARLTSTSTSTEKLSSVTTTGDTGSGVAGPPPGLGFAPVTTSAVSNLPPLPSAPVPPPSATVTPPDLPPLPPIPTLPPGPPTGNTPVSPARIDRRNPPNYQPPVSPHGLAGSFGNSGEGNGNVLSKTVSVLNAPPPPTFSPPQAATGQPTSNPFPLDRGTDSSSNSGSSNSDALIQVAEPLTLPVFSGPPKTPPPKRPTGANSAGSNSSFHQNAPGNSLNGPNTAGPTKAEKPEKHGEILKPTSSTGAWGVSTAPKVIPGHEPLELTYAERMMIARDLEQSSGPGLAGASSTTMKESSTVAPSPWDVTPAQTQTVTEPSPKAEKNTGSGANTVTTSTVGAASRQAKADLLAHMTPAEKKKLGAWGKSINVIPGVNSGGKSGNTNGAGLGGAPASPPDVFADSWGPSLSAATGSHDRNTASAIKDRDVTGVSNSKGVPDRAPSTMSGASSATATSVAWGQKKWVEGSHNYAVPPSVNSGCATNESETQSHSSSDSQNLLPESIWQTQSGSKKGNRNRKDLNLPATMAPPTPINSRGESSDRESTREFGDFSSGKQGPGQDIDSDSESDNHKSDAEKSSESGSEAGVKESESESDDDVKVQAEATKEAPNQPSNASKDSDDEVEQDEEEEEEDDEENDDAASAKSNADDDSDNDDDDENPGGDAGGKSQNRKNNGGDRDGNNDQDGDREDDNDDSDAEAEGEGDDSNFKSDSKTPLPNDNLPGGQKLTKKQKKNLLKRERRQAKLEGGSKTVTLKDLKDGKDDDAVLAAAAAANDAQAQSKKKKKPSQKQRKAQQLLLETMRHELECQMGAEEMLLHMEVNKLLLNRQKTMQDMQRKVHNLLLKMNVGGYGTRRRDFSNSIFRKPAVVVPGAAHYSWDYSGFPKDMVRPMVPDDFVAVPEIWSMANIESYFPSYELLKLAIERDGNAVAGKESSSGSGGSGSNSNSTASKTYTVNSKSGLASANVTVTDNTNLPKDKPPGWFNRELLALAQTARSMSTHLLKDEIQVSHKCDMFLLRKSRYYNGKQAVSDAEFFRYFRTPMALPNAGNTYTVTGDGKERITPEQMMLAVANRKKQLLDDALTTDFGEDLNILLDESCGRCIGQLFNAFKQVKGVNSVCTLKENLVMQVLEEGKLRQVGVNQTKLLVEEGTLRNISSGKPANQSAGTSSTTTGTAAAAAGSSTISANIAAAAAQSDKKISSLVEGSAHACYRSLVEILTGGPTPPVERASNGYVFHSPSTTAPVLGIQECMEKESAVRQMIFFAAWGHEPLSLKDRKGPRKLQPSVSDAVIRAVMGQNALGNSTALSGTGSNSFSKNFGNSIGKSLSKAEIEQDSEERAKLALESLRTISMKRMPKNQYISQRRSEECARTLSEDLAAGISSNCNSDFNLNVNSKGTKSLLSTGGNKQAISATEQPAAIFAMKTATLASAQMEADARAIYARNAAAPGSSTKALFQQHLKDAQQQIAAEWQAGLCGYGPGAGNGNLNNGNSYSSCPLLGPGPGQGPGPLNLNNNGNCAAGGPGSSAGAGNLKNGISNCLNPDSVLGQTRDSPLGRASVGLISLAGKVTGKSQEFVEEMMGNTMVTLSDRQRFSLDYESQSPNGPNRPNLFGLNNNSESTVAATELVLTQSESKSGNLKISSDKPVPIPGDITCANVKRHLWQLATFHLIACHASGNKPNSPNLLKDCLNNPNLDLNFRPSNEDTGKLYAALADAMAQHSMHPKAMEFLKTVTQGSPYRVETVKDCKLGRKRLMLLPGMVPDRNFDTRTEFPSNEGDSSDSNLSLKNKSSSEGSNCSTLSKQDLNSTTKKPFGPVPLSPVLRSDSIHDPYQASYRKAASKPMLTRLKELYQTKIKVVYGTIIGTPEYLAAFGGPAVFKRLAAEVNEFNSEAGVQSVHFKWNCFVQLPDASDEDEEEGDSGGNRNPKPNIPSDLNGPLMKSATEVLEQTKALRLQQHSKVNSMINYNSTTNSNSVSGSSESQSQSCNASSAPLSGADGLSKEQLMVMNLTATATLEDSWAGAPFDPNSISESRGGTGNAQSKNSFPKFPKPVFNQNLMEYDEWVDAYEEGMIRLTKKQRKNRKLMEVLELSSDERTTKLRGKPLSEYGYFLLSRMATVGESPREGNGNGQTDSSTSSRDYKLNQNLKTETRVIFEFDGIGACLVSCLVPAGTPNAGNVTPYRDAERALAARVRAAMGLSNSKLNTGSQLGSVTSAGELSGNFSGKCPNGCPNCGRVNNVNGTSSGNGGCSNSNSSNALNGGGVGPGGPPGPLCGPGPGPGGPGPPPGPYGPDRLEPQRLCHFPPVDQDAILLEFGDESLTMNPEHMIPGAVIKPGSVQPPAARHGPVSENLNTKGEFKLKSDSTLSETVNSIGPVADCPAVRLTLTDVTMTASKGTVGVFAIDRSLKQRAELVMEHNDSTKGDRLSKRGNSNFQLGDMAALDPSAGFNQLVETVVPVNLFPNTDRRGPSSIPNGSVVPRTSDHASFFDINAVKNPAAALAGLSSADTVDSIFKRLSASGKGNPFPRVVIPSVIDYHGTNPASHAVLNTPEESQAAGPGPCTSQTAAAESSSTTTNSKIFNLPPKLDPDRICASTFDKNLALLRGWQPGDACPGYVSNIHQLAFLRGAQVPMMPELEDLAERHIMASGHTLSGQYGCTRNFLANIPTQFQDAIQKTFAEALNSYCKEKGIATGGV